MTRFKLVRMGNLWGVFDTQENVHILRDESHAVASNVEHAANNPDHWEPSEACEIASDHLHAFPTVTT